MRLITYSIALFLTLSSYSFAVEENIDSSSRAFGSMPDVWGVRISPDGSKISMIHQHRKEDLPVLIVYDVKSQKGELILASQKEDFWINWCDWANNERLLCGFKGNVRRGYDYFVVTRLVGVNTDGSNMKVLLQRRLRFDFSQFQDRIVDWLVDDKRHVLVQVHKGNNTGVAKLDIYSGSISRILRPRRNVRYYMADGHGQIRLHRYLSDEKVKWRYTLAGEDDWHTLYEADITDNTDFYPVGFGDDPNTVLIMKAHDGRLALWAEDLTDQEKSRVVYAHSDVDVAGVKALGKYRRLVGARYITDVAHVHFFDDAVRRVVNVLEANMPDKVVSVIDEDWDRRFYLIHIGNDRDPGSYFRFDREKNHLYNIIKRYPSLEHKKLAKNQPIEYQARDGVEIPAYLTLPVEAGSSKLPTVILPHGGPESRDVWGFDWLPQFLASRGYAVLQPNFRGSGGYGEDWAGEGGFKAWRQALSDITDGTRYLMTEGIADPQKICVAGWSYGGYAALMSGLEEAELYQCVVAIAPVTDPRDFIEDYRHFVAGRAVREFVGTSDEVIKQGSPLKRADEMTLPVLLLHGDMDVNVEVDQSKRLADALDDEDKDFEVKIYENIDHQFETNAARIDMLTRMGRFLDRHIGEQAKTPLKTPQASAPAPSGS